MSATILIVDDNLKNIQLLEKTLRKDGYQVDFSLNGMSAIKKIERNEFDLVLLDVIMPEMNGFEVCSVIRSKYKHKDIPIIFLTAKADRDSVVKGFELGGQDYISKPFDSRELLVRVKTHIELKQNRQVLKDLNRNLERKVMKRTMALQEANEALQESEKKYRHALEVSSNGIWDWNLESDQIEYSLALYNILGYEYNEFPQNRKELIERMHPDDKKDRDRPDYIDRIRQKNLSQLHDEYRLKTKHGEYKWIKEKGQVFERNKKGEITRMIGTFIDVTSEKQKNQEILRAILKTEDKARSRISNDIHDGLQQTLTISLLNFEYAKNEIEKLDLEAIEKFYIGWDYLQKGITESRVVAHSLMPKAIVDLGLVSACESMIDLMNKTVPDTEFRFMDNFENKRLDNPNVEITLYRVMQEAINNIIKYAKASTVDIQLKNYDDVILLIIQDNGVGFDVKNDSNIGFGLKSIKNRLAAINGHFDIESSGRLGTSIIARIDKNQTE